MQRRRRVQNVGHAAAFSWPCVKMIPTTTRARMYILYNIYIQTCLYITILSNWLKYSVQFGLEEFGVWTERVRLLTSHMIANFFFAFRNPCFTTTTCISTLLVARGNPPLYSWSFTGLSKKGRQKIMEEVHYGLLIETTN